jgi:hypothetical protein
VVVVFSRQELTPYAKQTTSVTHPQCFTHSLSQFLSIHM